jgi:CRP/FNR family transcriptional regulator, cyclic AMP receptor protein
MRGNRTTVSADMSAVAAGRHSHDARRRETADTCDVRQALIASGIFRKTAPEVASVYAKQLTPVRFPPGCVIDDDSELGGRLCVIVSGKVKVSCRSVDGCEFLSTMLGSSEIYGIIKLFDPAWQRTRAVTLTVTWAVPIRRDQLLTWIAERPEISDQVLRLVARRAKALTNILVDFSCTEVQARVASRLLCLRKRFGWREGEGVRVAHDLTLEEFSLLVGVAPVTVAATLREFEDRGWIRLEDNDIVIEDGQALNQVQTAPTSEVCCV